MVKEHFKIMKDNFKDLNWIEKFLAIIFGLIFAKIFILIYLILSINDILKSIYKKIYLLVWRMKVRIMRGQKKI